MAEIVEDATSALVRYVPAGREQDELLGLVRLGLRFKAQQAGKRPGTLSRLILSCARHAGPPYRFEQLLDQLELCAARRELNGEHASPVEKVDRTWNLITIHLPRRGRVQVSFATARNHLTTSKKILLAEFPLSAKA